jgi:hypothetical protein
MMDRYMTNTAAAAAGLRAVADRLAGMPVTALPSTVVSVSMQVTPWDGQEPAARFAVIDLLSAAFGLPTKLRQEIRLYGTPPLVAQVDGVDVSVFGTTLTKAEAESS